MSLRLTWLVLPQGCLEGFSAPRSGAKTSDGSWPPLPVTPLDAREECRRQAADEASLASLVARKLGQRLSSARTNPLKLLKITLALVYRE